MLSIRSTLMLAAIALSHSAAAVAQAGRTPESAEVGTARDTSEDWEALESGNPASPDYRNRVISTAKDANAAWEAGEATNPHNPQFGKGAEVEVMPEQHAAAR
jgi:hypothetical protein